MNKFNLVLTNFLFKHIKDNLTFSVSKYSADILNLHSEFLHVLTFNSWLFLDVVQPCFKLNNVCYIFQVVFG